MTNPISDTNDLYDVHERLTPQHQQLQSHLPSARPSIPSASAESRSIALRRTQRLDVPLPKSHIAAASVGIPPLPQARSPPQTLGDTRQNPEQNFSSDSGTSTPPASSVREPAAARPQKRSRVSGRTASAILYALEEALRHPNPFTADLVEENASMSDLTAGGASPAGVGRSANNGSSRIQGPAPVGSPSNRGGIRGPSDIMRERTAREAKRKAEHDALERNRAEEEQRLIEEERRRSAEKRVAAAGVTGGARPSGEGVMYRSSSSATAPGQRLSDPSQRLDPRSGERVVSGTSASAQPPRSQDPHLQGRGTGGRAVGGGEPVPATSGRVRGPSISAGQPRTVRPEDSQRAPSGATQAQPGPSAIPAQDPEESTASRKASNKIPFPHAFERWETLSSHWEGLTSYWIRRIEDNSNEGNRDPLNQQMARQITDLSAAGANLFHAVVELQRLRASSERKFQRWFFETRAEQERAREMTAMLETALSSERRDRSEAIAAAVAHEQANSGKDKIIAEMGRELRISKEEARRAWEELGRREQEERDRTTSLREGHPTIVGGVQVVPMIPGAPNRHESTQATGGDVAEGPGDSGEESDGTYRQNVRAQRGDDPAVYQSGSGQSSSSTAQPNRPAATASSYAQPQHYTHAPTPPSSSAPFYQHAPTTADAVYPPSEEGRSSPMSESAISDEEYEIDNQGHIRLDAHGNKIPYRPVATGVGSDGRNAPVTHGDDDYAEREYASRYGPDTTGVYAPSSGVSYGYGPTSAPAPRTTRARPQTIHEDPAYTGEAYGSPEHHAYAEEEDQGEQGAGYGSGPGWEGIPRHHHPTRLSDVLEEDERSRGSASQVSRG